MSTNGGLVNADVIEAVLAANRFIDSTKNGQTVLTIQNPTQPRKVSPNSTLIFSLSIGIGGTIGAFLVLILHLIKKRKELLVKA